MCLIVYTVTYRLVLSTVANSIGLVCLAFVVPVVIGFQLRPIGDDYCYVVSVTQVGLVQFALDQSTNWSGALLTNAAAAAFGYLQHFDFHIAYAVLLATTFTLSYLSFALVLRNIGRAFGFREETKILLTSIFLTLGFFMANFGIPATTSSDDFPFGYATLGWGAAILSQLIPNLILLLGAGLVIAGRGQLSHRHSWMLIVISVAIPLFSIQAGVAWILFCVLLSLRPFRAITGSEHHLLTPVGIALTVTLLNVLSPGSQNRKSVIGDVGSGDLLSGLARSLRMSLESSLGSLTVFGALTGVLVVFLAGRSFRVSNSSIIQYGVLALAVFSSVTLTDALGAYEPWHQGGWRLSVYLVSVLIGVLLAGCLLNRQARPASRRMRLWIFLVLLACWSFVFIFQAVTVFGFLRERSIQIDLGRAQPVAWIADTEVEWIQYCANWQPETAMATELMNGVQ